LLFKKSAGAWVKGVGRGRRAWSRVKPKLPHPPPDRLKKDLLKKDCDVALFCFKPYRETAHKGVLGYDGRVSRGTLLGEKKGIAEEGVNWATKINLLLLRLEVMGPSIRKLLQRICQGTLLEWELPEKTRGWVVG